MAFEEDARFAVDALARWESSSRTRAMPVLHQPPLAELVRSLEIPRWIRDGGNIVCFRVEGSDSLQLEIRRRLLQRGEHYVSTTAFRGRRWLRLAVMNPSTELEDVARLADAVQAERRAVGSA